MSDFYSMNSFYIDKEKKVVDPKLFTETAEEIANTFVSKGKDSEGNPFYGVSGSQLRRFFDEAKRFKQNLDGTKPTWDIYFPQIRMIKAKVRYNTARVYFKKPKEKDVYDSLSSFVTKCIDIIKDEKEYNAFISLFEAVYGYYYPKAPKRARD